MLKRKVIARRVTLEKSRQYHKLKIQNTTVDKKSIFRPASSSRTRNNENNLNVYSLNIQWIKIKTILYCNFVIKGRNNHHLYALNWKQISYQKIKMS